MGERRSNERVTMLDKLDAALGAMSLGKHLHQPAVDIDYKDDVDLQRLIEEDMLDTHDRMVHMGTHYQDVSVDSERASPMGSSLLLDVSATSSGRTSPVTYDNPDPQHSSKPVDIRGHEGSSIPKSMSLPLDQLTPNPFPELLGSTVSLSGSSLGAPESSKSSPSSPLLRVKEQSRRRQSNPPLVLPRLSSPEKEEDTWRPQSYNKMMLNIYSDQQNYKTVTIDASVTTSDLCHMLVLKNHTAEDKNWTIVEHLGKYNLERSLEDHEQVLPACSSWNSVSDNHDNRLYFRKDFRKYAMFHNPTQFFPLQMMNIRETSCWDLLDRVERHKNLLLKNLFSSGEQLPDIHGYLHFKEGKKSWKKAYFVLRKSGLFYSSKGLLKDPSHLVLYADITDSVIYQTNNAKKTFGAHSQYGFCLKPADKSGSDIKDLKILCADDEQSRMCWISGLRLNKYGGQLTSNYKAAIKREGKLRNMDTMQQLSHSDEDIYVKSRVAMDFTGMKGRVVDDPAEAISVAIEEGHTWRRKVVGVKQVVRSPLSQSPSNTAANYMYSQPNLYSPVVEMQIHVSQPWFHNGLHREEAVELITSHGLVDGVFLIRTSHKVPGTFVLSLAHNQKVKHCQIIKVVEDGMQYYSLDGGYTKFTDLLQLVEFYQVNPAGLPTRLKHYVTRLM